MSLTLRWWLWGEKESSSTSDRPMAMNLGSSYLEIKVAEWFMPLSSLSSRENCPRTLGTYPTFLADTKALTVLKCRHSVEDGPLSRLPGKTIYTIRPTPFNPPLSSTQPASHSAHQALRPQAAPVITCRPVQQDHETTSYGDLIEIYAQMSQDLDNLPGGFKVDLKLR